MKRFVKKASLGLFVVVAAMLLMAAGPAVAQVAGNTIQVNNVSDPAGAATGTVTSAPAGVSCATGNSLTSDECSVTVANEAVQVILTATADTGSAFSNFSSGSCKANATLGANQCEVAIDQATEVVTARFVPLANTQQPLTVQTAGTGEGSVTSAPAGINCARPLAAPSNDCTESYMGGTTVTLTAAPKPFNLFNGFSSNCAPVSGQPTKCTVSMDAAKTVVANFTAVPPPSVLTVSVEGNGTGRVSSDPAGIDCTKQLPLNGSPPGPECVEDFTGRPTVTLTATPGPDSRLQEFTSNCKPVSGQPLKCTVDPRGGATVRATFAPTRAVRVELAGTGEGRVLDSPNRGINCPGDCSEAYGTQEEVVLIAEPSSNSSFESFSSNCRPASRPSLCVVSPSSREPVTATFRRLPKLAVELKGTGEGRVVSSPKGINCPGDCSEAFPIGTDVALAAENSSDSFFKGFSSNCASIGGTSAGAARACSLRIGADEAVTATFDLLTDGNSLNIQAVQVASRSATETQELADEVKKTLDAALVKAKAKLLSEADALAEARKELGPVGVRQAERDYQAAKAAREALLPAIRASQQAQVSATKLNDLLDAVAKNPTEANKKAVEAQIPTFRDDFRAAAAKMGVAAISDKLPTNISVLLAIFGPNIKELGEQTLQEALEAGFELALGNPGRLVDLVNKARRTVDGLGPRFDKKFQSIRSQDDSQFTGAMKLIYSGLDVESEILLDAIGAGIDQNKAKLTKLYGDAVKVNEQLKNKIKGAVTAVIEDDITKGVIRRTEAAVKDAVDETKKIANKVLDIF